MKKGFTIVETLVAISILVLVIIGAGSAVQTGISSYIFSKDQIVAFYLAQEAFEQVRNIRDNNGLNAQNWLTGLAANPTDACYFGNTCIVDPINSNTPTICSSGPGTCPFLRQDPVDGFFGYNAGWQETVFRREITLTQVNANEISVLVTVDWSKGVTHRQFRARENLFNWQ